jgi:hypothetical protein
MVLALDYMQRTNTGDAALVDRARAYVAQGYERLLGFEVPTEPGGFDWWGKAPANVFLTAYGLMEFTALARVHPVDPRLLPRMAAFLASKQSEDGSWRPPEDARQAWSTDMARGQAFNLTAYVCWGLARAGRPSEKGVAWVRDHAHEADDAYSVALAALALLASDPKDPAGRALVDGLAERAIRGEEGVHWETGLPTAIGARGESAKIEATALAIQALALDGRHRGLVARGVDRLVRWRDPEGTFGTTQSTILALEALLAADPGGPRGALRLEVRGRDRTLAEADVDPRSTAPLRLPLETEDGRLSLTMAGEGTVRATLSKTAWRSWAEAPAPTGRVALRVAWPGEALRVGRRSLATVEVSNPTEALASVVTVEVGLPPGVEVKTGDVEGPAERVELGERRLVLYLRDLAGGQTATFRVPFTPRVAFDVLTAPSKAYEYYVPEEAHEVPPARVRAVP